MIVLEEKKEIGKGLYKNTAGAVGIFMGNFPEKLAKEWEQDCQKYYGGCRWMKAYSDHCKARVLEMDEDVQTLFDTVEKESKEEEVELKKESEIPIIGRREER